MNIKSLSKKLLLSVSTIILLSGCVEKLNLNEVETNITLNPSLALPIGSIHANVMNLISFVDSNYVKTDTRNGFYVCYETPVEKMNFVVDEFRTGERLEETLTLRTVPELQNVFDILDQINVQEAPLPQGEYSFSKESLYYFGFNEYVEGEKDIHVDSAIIKSATIEFMVDIEGIEINDGTYLELSFHFPGLFNEEYEQRFENIPITKSHFVYSNEMKKFMAHFDTQIAASNATLLSVDFKIVSDGTSKITNDAKINFETEINLMDFEEIYGHVWQKEAYKGDKVVFNIPNEIFKNDLLNNNKILFSNPQVDISLHSNIGVPMLLCIDEMKYTKNNETHTLKCDNKCRFEIEQPKWEGENHLTQITLNRTNSPIAELLNAFPEKVELDWTVYTNDSVREHVHYFINPIVADMSCNISLPFQFDPTTNFTYKDTLPADIATIIGNQGIIDAIALDTFNLYLDISSKFPANAMIKLFYLDEDDDLLFESKPFGIQAAQVNEEGRVISETKETLILGANGESINDVLETKNIVFEIVISGYDEHSHIYFQSTDAIDIDVSAFVKVNPSINLTNNSNTL